jgi:hypothetical protein
VKDHVGYITTAFRGINGRMRLPQPAHAPYDLIACVNWPGTIAVTKSMYQLKSLISPSIVPIKNESVVPLLRLSFPYF